MHELGQPMHAFDLDKLAEKFGKKVPGLKRDSGLIGVQNHGDPVSFRNIRISRIFSFRPRSRTTMRLSM